MTFIVSLKCLLKFIYFTTFAAHWHSKGTGRNKESEILSNNQVAQSWSAKFFIDESAKNWKDFSDKDQYNQLCKREKILRNMSCGRWPILTLVLSLLEKIVTRSLEGGGGVNRTPSSTFDTIHPIDLKFGTYSKLHLYFQLSETTWCLICFHGNNSQINDVTGGRQLGFSNFQILFKFSLLYLRLTGKQHLEVEIQEIGRIHCEIVSI